MAIVEKFIKINRKLPCIIDIVAGKEVRYQFHSDFRYSVTFTSLSNCIFVKMVSAMLRIAKPEL